MPVQAAIEAPRLVLNAEPNFYKPGAAITVQIEGRPVAAADLPEVQFRRAMHNYFETMGIPLRRGRTFDATDGTTTPPVAVINETMARKLWPGQDPLGKRIKYGDAASESPWETVVGVVGRVKQYGLDADARMAFYRPHTQSPSRALFVTVRTAGDPAALAPAVAREIRAFDSDLPLYHVQPMSRRVDESLARERFAATLLTIFAVLALALAAIGVYGVMAYLVTQGVREIGIRVALGATPSGILTLVMRQGALMAGAGLAAGLAGAFMLARVMESLLFGITARDPLTFAVVSVTLAVVAAAAVAVPAIRATRVNPIEALRND